MDEEDLRKNRRGNKNYHRKKADRDSKKSYRQKLKRQTERALLGEDEDEDRRWRLEDHDIHGELNNE